jgi:hypothetical protein
MVMPILFAAFLKGILFSLIKKNNIPSFIDTLLKTGEI